MSQAAEELPCSPMEPQVLQLMHVPVLACHALVWHDSVQLQCSQAVLQAVQLMHGPVNLCCALGQLTQ